MNARLRRPVVVRAAKSMGVSVFTTMLSTSILIALLTFTGLRASVANGIATVAGIGPSYALNRRWVWKRHGTSRALREIVPFWVLSLSGLVLSTLAVDRAALLAARIGLSGPVRTATLVAANLATFGVLWIAQFLVLDRWLFGRDLHRPAPPSAPDRSLLTSPRPRTPVHAA